MIGREVERGEVVVVGLDLRTFRHREAERGEDLDDLFGHPGERMDRPRQRAPAGQREVGPVRREGLPALLGLQGLEAGRDRGLDRGLGPVRLLAHLRPVRGGNAAERPQQRGELARAAEHADADLLEVGRGAGPGDIRQGPVEDLLDARVPRHAQARWARAVSASLANAVGSDTASSARILRSRAMPAFLRPAMKAEYDSPSCRQAAFTRMIQSERARRFFCLRPL